MSLFSSSTREAEAAAFKRAASKLSQIKRGELQLPSAPRPKRLANIYTGALEANTDSNHNPKPFVIVSYVWTPQRLPKTPTYGWVRRKAPWDLDQFGNVKPSEQTPELRSWVAGSPYFDEWAELLAFRYPDIVEIEAVAGVDEPEFICPPNRPDGISPVYLEEVFNTAAKEAYRRGIDYVWMDSLCVDQADPADVADQVPKMRDYYSQATCCVVIAETVRRKVAPMEPVQGTISSPYPSAGTLVGKLESTENILKSWVVGFHDERVWTLQETLLSQQVVARAANIRINISKIFDTNFTPSKHIDIGNWTAVLNALPLSGITRFAGTSITPQHCLRLCRPRNAFKFQDQIYGVLGLFPEAVRYSVPVDYELSMGAVAAIFAYLRVANGDLSPLLTLWNPRFDRCAPGVCPSWVPCGFTYPETEITNFVPHEDLDAGVDEHGQLRMTTKFINVAEIVRLKDWRSSHDEFELGDLMDNSNIAITLRGSDGNNFPMVYAGTIEPVGEGIVDELGQGHSGGSEAEKLRTETLKCLKEAASKGNAVIATIGRDPRPLDGGGNQDIWAWLLLAEDEGGETWCRRGVVFTDGLPLDEEARRRFCIR